MKILCIEDDKVDRKIVERTLRRKFGDELNFETAASAETAYQKVEANGNFDIILLDYQLGSTTGMEVLQEFNDRKVDSPVILLTGLGDEQIAIEALKLGAYDYFTKDQLSSERIIQSIINITERKKAEEKIESEREKLQNIMNSMVDGVTITDTDGKIISVNKAALSQLGCKKDKIIGKNLEEIYLGEKSSTLKEIFNRLTSEHTIRNQEFMVEREDGTNFPVSVNFSLLENSPGEEEAIVAVHRDITERKKREKALREAKEKAEIANRTKSEFLATMSHEIRTPMNAVIGMSELLTETELNDVQKKYVEISRNAGENLLDIINDILDLSKVESGEIKLEKASFNLTEIVEKTCDVMALRAHKKGIELSNHINPDVPVNLVGDQARLRQIFVNLLGNAVKFTDEGEIELNIEFADKEEANAYKNTTGKENVKLLFSVRDTGVGIPKEKRKTIFESFTQADSSTTREYGGTGLGLTICERLVNLMGGEIWVESKVAKGSTFYFTANFEIGEKPSKYIEPEEIEEVEIKGLKTLVVDDNETNRLILKEILTFWGADIEEATNGEDAISKIELAFKEDNPFELILLDYRMPGMNGVEVLEKINKEFPEDYVTVMMLTSDHRADVLSEIKGMGIGAYLVKPVKKEELKKAVVNIMKKTAEEEKKETEKEKKEKLSPLKILLVEDTEDNILLIKAYLKKTPYEINVAKNGKIAVGKIKSENYDLVLMDMQMPVMDGFTATKKIREWEKHDGRGRTTIIALTAYAMKEEIEKTLNAGCDAHLKKPIKKEKLLKTIKKYG